MTANDYEHAAASRRELAELSEREESATPRTDAASYRLPSGEWVTPADTSHNLESELAESNRQRDELMNALKECAAELPISSGDIRAQAYIDATTAIARAQKGAE